ncbi:MAG: NAD(P)H-hydrate dehydratase [Parachlamydiales bacterium]
MEREQIRGVLKVLSASEMARIEREAYTRGASDRHFMTLAGEGIAHVVESYVKEHDLPWVATVLCGKGNNAGDAYVAARHLIGEGYPTRALQLAPIESASALCQEMRQAFQAAGGQVIDCHGEGDIQLLSQGIILDGILGTGFRGELKGLYAAAAERANRSGLPIIAIDIPSGINGNTGEGSTHAIEATVTVALGQAKRGCFLGEGWNHLGELQLVDFGLPTPFVEDGVADFWLMTRKAAGLLLPKVRRNRHKYEAGYVVGIAGSEGMPGAALLAGEAALRSGAGMMRLFHRFAESPHELGAVHELLHEPLVDAEGIVKRLYNAGALFIGPGMGTDGRVAALLQELLAQVKVPCVMDADGLAILAERGLPLPKGTILTPHRGEMSRLLGKKPEDFDGELEWLTACGQYARERGVVLIVKGGPTFVFSPEGEIPYVIPFGDPGMATAGSGDVLTGILAALLAQGCKPLEAALLGGTLHGLAGEGAARRLTSYSMIASDITRELPFAFRDIQRANR